jgi:SRSO17 transposase
VFVKTEMTTAAAAPSLDLEACGDRFAQFMGLFAHRFRRVEPRRHAAGFVRTLLAELPRVNCWTAAEHAGHATPDAFQNLLARAKWDHDGVRDDLRDYVVGHLGHGGSVLVLDETGDLKKGSCTVAAQRQYTGTAGRIENAQVAVYAVWATPRGHGFIDRELYVPESWTDDPERCAAAGLPEGRTFATKPELALAIVKRAVAADHRPGFVAADEVYGNAGEFRAGLEELGLGYVLAVSCSTLIDVGPARIRADVLARELTGEGWQIRSAGPGSKGLRLYQWAYLHLDEPVPERGQRYLLIRCSIRTGELAYYRCWTPQPVTLQVLVTVAGMRWRVEESFQAGKGLTGLDEHQVRRYTSWARWTVLAMLAHAFLAILAAEQPDPPADTDMIPLTCQEIAHLLATMLFNREHPHEHRWAWSRWRRHRQHRARTYHYQRRSTQTA